MQISFTSPPPRDTGYDVAIVGGGPAGGTCGGFRRSGGLVTAGGVDVCGGSAVEKIGREQGAWLIEAAGRHFSARALVAADGRNSTVARLLGMLPAASKDRVALQTHFPAPADFGERVAMRF